MDNKDYFHRVTSKTATRFWINNVTRKEAEVAINAGAIGCTQNPSYTWKMLNTDEEKDYVLKILDSILEEEPDDNEALIKTQRELVKKIAEFFLPIYERSNGKQGFVSIQGDPFEEDIGTLIKYARFNRESGPNIMAKIPVTEEGIKAIATLAKERIPINATEVMAVKQAIDVCEEYVETIKGLENPAPIFISHITGIYEEYLNKYVKEKNIDISKDALWISALSIAKKTYWIMKEKRYPVGFIGGGARDLHHFTDMVGAEVDITINWIGTADKLIELDLPVVQRFFEMDSYSMVDELLEKVEDYRKGYLINSITPAEYESFGPVVYFRNMFEADWEKARTFVNERRKSLT